jgi:hypothetical protein
MAIKFDNNGPDAQGLPVVSWAEDRNLFAPGGVSPARVSCFIRPGADGSLQFVAAGPVRHGPDLQARSWQRLVSFERSSADHLYYSEEDRARMKWLRSKDKTGAITVATTDGALVILAHFDDERPTDPMHLNCAVASPVEAMQLHDRLTREFIANRPGLTEALSNGEYKWPQGKPFTVYEPPAPAMIPPWMNWLINLSIAAVLGGLGFVFYWAVIRQH